MKYVKFGNTGMDVSKICLGMMSFGKPGEEIIKRPETPYVPHIKTGLF